MRTKLYLMLTIALIVLGGTALAQDNPPKFELFGGYSYLRTAGNTNVNGWNAQAACDLNKWVGVVADFGGLYQTQSNDTIRPGASIFSFMFGPQLSDRAGRITGFAHVLFGGARLSRGFNLGAGGTPNTITNLALIFGGGMDVNVNDMFAVRLFQVDYDRIRTPNPLTVLKEGRNNFRLSIGLVFKVKGK